MNKAAVAHAVCTLVGNHTPNVTGRCLYWAMYGKLAFEKLGVHANIISAPAMLTLGPGQFDLIDYGMRGDFPFGEGKFLGHAWLEVDGEIVDFSMVDVPAIAKQSIVETGLPFSKEARKALKHPPLFLWGTAEEVLAVDMYDPRPWRLVIKGDG